MEPGEHTELSLEADSYDQAFLRFLDFARAQRREREAIFHGQSLRQLIAEIDQKVLATPATQQTERARLLYEAENKANEFVMAGDALVEAVVYKLLYARGLRIASIDNEIRKALDQRLGIR